jgi:hypothetical protein
MTATTLVRRAGFAALVLGFFACAAIAFGQEAPPPAYQVAAQQAGVPPPVLYAVALQESGARLRGRLIPWPWTLNVAGRAERYGPVVENVSTALAQYASDHFVRVTAKTALTVAVVIVGGALAVAGMLVWRLRWAHESALLVPILFAAVLTPVALALWLLYRSMRRRGN